MNGFILSNEGITRGVTTKGVNRIGELLGFEHSTICYNLRFMAGNNMDRSVDVSEALRNLVMDHAPNSDTFRRHYLNRNVCADVWAIHRSSEPQQALLELATSHGHYRSSRRPANLAAEQSANLKNHPQLVNLLKELGTHHRLSPEYRQLRLKIKSTKAMLFKAEKDRIKKEWTATQAIEDIQWQIRQGGFQPSPSTTRASRPMTTTQEVLNRALGAPAVHDLEAYCHRRATAIIAVADCCGVQEPLRTRVLEARIATAPAELRSTPKDRAEQLWNSVLVSRVGSSKLSRCFICVGKALTLPPNDSNFNDLCRTFSAPAEVVRHFKSVHLSKLKSDSKVVCPICIPKVTLEHKMHLQNHAESIHGISSMTGFDPRNCT
ncbi:hypothetical protein F5Y18DRAFT_193700 [Xylariaceae sp. FL1019]|nr:hypothetical protein F5Y18DRAFT_193700 [Xylariaceae sp. FL1019]